MNLETMIEIKKGKIQDAPEILNVDAVVNCAKPTLMGSRSNVDGAIHSAVDTKNSHSGYFKERIKEQFEDQLGTKKEQVIRCNRGEAVITKGYGFCTYIIHAVGPKSDRNEGKWNGIYSNSCVETLTRCYQSVMQQIFKHPEIEKIAVPVISSGNYGFDFEYAFTIGLTAIYNSLLEQKKEKGELFKYIGLKKVYFIVPDEMDHYTMACNVFEKYRKTFQKEHRATMRGVWQSQKELWKEISMYDTQKGYFAIAKIVRQLLMIFRMILGFWTYLKDVVSKEDWMIRRQAVEIITFIKMLLPIPIMYLGVWKCENHLLNMILMMLIIYDLLDTITYLLSLMFLSDIQRPSANVTRSLVMLIVNYIEVELDVACICLLFQNLHETYIAVGNAIDFIVSSNGEAVFKWLYWINGGIQFFFLTIALSYFSSHIRQRKFRTY